MILISFIQSIQSDSLPHEQYIWILVPSPVDLFITMSSCSRSNPLHIWWRGVGSPLFPAGIRILQVSTGPEEDAEDGLRHQAACLRRCNRQVGPGEQALSISMPPASFHLKPDE